MATFQRIPKTTSMKNGLKKTDASLRLCSSNKETPASYILEYGPIDNSAAPENSDPFVETASPASSSTILPSQFYSLASTILSFYLLIFYIRIPAAPLTAKTFTAFYSSSSPLFPFPAPLANFTIHRRPLPPVHDDLPLMNDSELQNS